MAEPRDDNPSGRLLFTDFDASDKGRPVVELDALRPAGSDRATAVSPYLLSLEELVSSLDLDFEDDAAPTAPSTSPDTVTPAIDDEAVFQTGQPAYTMLESDESAPPVLNDQWLWPEESAPTWEQFARSFTGGGKKPDAAPTRPEEEDYTQLPTDAYSTVEDEGWYDVEGLDDMLADGGEDLDILSVIPPAAELDDEDQVHRPFEGQWRGHRLGVKPPPDRPYGRIKRLTEWFRPPEITEDEHAVGPVENRYEPPEDYLPGDRGRTEMAIDIGLLDEGREESTNFPESAVAEDGKTEIFEKTGPDETSITRHIDVFDNLDLDALWNEKAERKFSSHTSSRFKSTTRDHDVFSDMDIDAVWDSRQPHAADASTDTVILDKKHPDDTGTVILSENDVVGRMRDRTEIFGKRADPAPRPAPRAKKTAEPQWEEDYRAAHSAGSDNPDLIEPGDALGFLDDLDGIVSEGVAKKSAGASTAAVEKKPAGKAGKKTPESDTEEEFNLDALIAETDTAELLPARDVAAPIIGNDDINTDTRRMESVIQGGASSSVDDPFAAPARPKPKREAAIKPPVVNDDSLETPGSGVGVERSGTREMEALFGERGEGDEAEEQGEDAAVDPMDMFADIDDMDFSDDGMDDEMRAMLEDDEEDTEEESAGQMVAAEPVPADLKGKVFYYIRKVRTALFTPGLFKRILRMVAWRENWWFYCDLAAALIASASLAIILSYYIWYQ